MKTLIKYEIKKIITKKSILFTFPLILLFVLWLFILPFFQENITLPSGESYRGMKAVKILKKQPDIHLNAQEVNRLIAKYQNLAKDKKNYPNGDPSQIEFKNRINHSFVLPNYEALNLIANVHSGAKRYVGHPEIRNIKTSKKTFNLYKKLGTNYHDIENGRKLNSSRYYSTSEKRYWENMVKKIKTPFKIGYQGAWIIIIDRLTFLFVPILFICILVSQAFIYDIQLRTITIIFPTMKGRRELVIAKLLSAYLVGVVYYSLFVFLVTVPLLSLYGIKGWDLPIQVQDPSIPYPWTLSQTVFIHFGIGLLILLGLITIILLSSLFVKKNIPIIMLTICLVLIPMIIPKSSEWLVYRLLVGILPITQLDMAYVDWISYSIFGKIFNVYSFNLVIYTLIVLIGVPMIIKKYSKYEID